MYFTLQIKLGKYTDECGLLYIILSYLSLSPHIFGHRGFGELGIRIDKAIK
jgi:hypothetical protein